MFRLLFLVLPCWLIIGCSEPGSDVRNVPIAAPPSESPAEHNYSYQVFVVVDSLGATHGVGYDIYDQSKKIIHQTTIPGEQGIEGFVDEKQAGQVAELVISKLESGGGFPTISREELQNLGITLQTK